MSYKFGCEQEKRENRQSELKPFGQFLLPRQGLLTPC